MKKLTQTHTYLNTCSNFLLLVYINKNLGLYLHTQKNSEQNNLLKHLKWLPYLIRKKKLKQMDFLTPYLTKTEKNNLHYLYYTYNLLLRINTVIYYRTLFWSYKRTQFYQMKTHTPSPFFLTFKAFRSLIRTFTTAFKSRAHDITNFLD